MTCPSGRTPRLTTQHPSISGTRWWPRTRPSSKGYDVRFGLYPESRRGVQRPTCQLRSRPFAYELPSGVMGAVAGVYGSGSVEYHTYVDTMDRFNEDSLEVSAVLYGTLIRSIAWP